MIRLRRVSGPSAAGAKTSGTTAGAGDDEGGWGMRLPLPTGPWVARPPAAATAGAPGQAACWVCPLGGSRSPRRGGPPRAQWNEVSSGRGCAWARRGLVMVSTATRPPAAQVAPAMKTAVRKPSASSAGMRPAAPLRPAKGGQERDGEETGGAGHRVVDGGGDARVLGRCGTHRRRGERRHGHGQADTEEQDGREDLHPVAARRGGPGQQGEAGSDQHGTHAHLQPGPDAGGELSGPGGEDEHDHRHREEGEPRVQRAVVGDHLQLHRQEEERPAERAVDDEGDGVGPTELADAEEASAAASGRRCALRRGGRPARRARR